MYSFIYFFFLSLFVFRFDYYSKINKYHHHLIYFHLNTSKNVSTLLLILLSVYENLPKNNFSIKIKNNSKAETQYHINTRATNRDPLNMAEAKAADLAKNNLSNSTYSQSSVEPSTSATKSNH